MAQNGSNDDGFNLFADVDEGDLVRITRESTDQTGDFKVVNLEGGVARLSSIESAVTIAVEVATGRTYSFRGGEREGFLGTVADVEVLDDDQDDDTVEIEILYVRNAHSRDAERLSPDDEGYQLARDLGCFAVEAFERNDVDATEAIEKVYASIGDPVEITLEPFDFGAYETHRVLDHVYSRIQGARNDCVLPYDGAHHRSARVGDVIVVDGTHYMIGSGFDFHELDVDERDDQDGDDLEPDGGVDVDPDHLQVGDRFALPGDGGTLAIVGVAPASEAPESASPGPLYEATILGVRASNILYRPHNIETALKSGAEYLGADDVARETEPFWCDGCELPKRGSERHNSFLRDYDVCSYGCRHEVVSARIRQRLERHGDGSKSRGE